MSIYNRTRPYIARIKERSLLTAPSSTKRTYHLALDLSSGPLPFTIGDSVAILPRNDPEIVEKILKSAHLDGNASIVDPKTKEPLSLRQLLETKANLTKIHSRLQSLLRETSFPKDYHVVDLISQARSHSYTPQELADVLLPLMPRFYSIASSSKMHPEEIHLTVSALSYEVQGKPRYGVASHFLCHAATIESTPIPLYIQPSNGFTLPAPDASIILIGPGTGIAPFRAFLQERLINQARGRNWLFFGERHHASDFYYEPFFTELVKQQLLRLDTAFSRDQPEKIYVQHRLLEHSASIWDWLQTGAYLYVCGNAEFMAKDVDASLRQIACKHGNFSEEKSAAYLRG
ncbi:MAG: sulfite reductase, partial [Chlamydiae bacterium]|nr:sulfite reductase [Chlamydiota bacterium]